MRNGIKLVAALGRLRGLLKKLTEISDSFHDRDKGS